MAQKYKYHCAACGDRSCVFTTSVQPPKGLVPVICPFSERLEVEWSARATLKDVADNG